MTIKVTNSTETIEEITMTDVMTVTSSSLVSLFSQVGFLVVVTQLHLVSEEKPSLSSSPSCMTRVGIVQLMMIREKNAHIAAVDITCPEYWLAHFHAHDSWMRSLFLSLCVYLMVVKQSVE